MDNAALIINSGCFKCCFYILKLFSEEVLMLFKLVINFVCIVFLISCGGGGGSEGSSPIVTPPIVTPPNVTPSVELGENINMVEGETISLEITASDSDGTIAKYQWRKDGELILESSDNNGLNFTATQVDLETSYTIEITVIDDDGATAKDSIIILVDNLPIIGTNTSEFGILPFEGFSFKTYNTTGAQTGAGYTDVHGRLTCEKGQKVEFSAGNIPLGETTCSDYLSLKDILSPNSDYLSDTFVNYLVFVQSIDKDRNYDNGLQLPETMQTLTGNADNLLNFNIPTSNFIIDSTVVGIIEEHTQLPLVSPESAQENWLTTNVNFNIFLEQFNSQVENCDDSRYPCIPDSFRPKSVIPGINHSYSNPTLFWQAPPEDDFIIGFQGYPYLANGGSAFTVGENLHDVVAKHPDLYNIGQMAGDIGRGVVSFYRNEVEGETFSNLYLNEMPVAYTSDLVGDVPSQEQCGFHKDGSNIINMALPAGTYHYDIITYGEHYMPSFGIIPGGPQPEKPVVYQRKMENFTVEAGSCQIIDLTKSDEPTNDTEITNGSWVSSGGQDHASQGNQSYQLVVEGNQTVDILLESEIDTFLYLLDEAGNLVEHNDDIETDVNSNSNINIELTTGSYIIVAATYFTEETGEFTLTVNGNSISLSAVTTEPVEPVEPPGAKVYSIQANYSKFNQVYSTFDSNGRTSIIWRELAANDSQHDSLYITTVDTEGHITKDIIGSLPFDTVRPTDIKVSASGVIHATVFVIRDRDISMHREGNAAVYHVYGTPGDFTVSQVSTNSSNAEDSTYGIYNVQAYEEPILSLAGEVAHISYMADAASETDWDDYLILASGSSNWTREQIFNLDELGETTGERVVSPTNSDLMIMPQRYTNNPVIGLIDITNYEPRYLYLSGDTWNEAYISNMPSGYLTIKDMKLITDNDDKHHFVYHHRTVDQTKQKIVHIAIDGANNELVRTVDLPENIYQYSPATIDTEDNNKLYGFYNTKSSNEGVIYSVDGNNNYLKHEFITKGSPTEKTSFHVLNQKISLTLEDDSNSHNKMIHVYHFEASLLDQ